MLGLPVFLQIRSTISNLQFNQLAKLLYLSLIHVLHAIRLLTLNTLVLSRTDRLVEEKARLTLFVEFVTH